MKKGISVFLSALFISLFLLTSCSSDIATSSDSLYDSSYSTTYNEEFSNTSSANIISTYADTSSDTTVSDSTSSEYKKPSRSSNHSHNTDQDKKSITVYITKTGEKYHRSGCRYLKRSKIEISLKEAKAEGYTPCSVCCPPQ